MEALGGGGILLSEVPLYPESLGDTLKLRLVHNMPQSPSQIGYFWSEIGLLVLT